ncbi:MAG: cation:proton antiporter, partial [Alphaproteobacteria bacterium]|nr:cation:proton antiporter [Alphaproteobacteria bacterium]
GRASFSILLLQDLAVVPILLLVTVMGDKSGASTGMLLLKSLGQAVAAIVVIILIGRFLVRPAFKFVSQFRSPELFMAVTLLTILGLASLSAAAGLSMALGAFMAGLLLAETEYRHQIEVDIEPFKGLFLGLFFMSVGMGIDVAAIFDNAITLIVAVIVVMALKAAVTGALCRPFGLPRHAAMECGVLLSQVSEFAFVVIGLGITFEVLPAKEGQLLLIIVSLSMLLTPTLSGFARKLAQSLEDKATQETAQAHGAADDELKDHIIIAGFGRVGRTVARVFQGQNIKFVALDLHAESVARARAEKLPVYYGDASRSDIMERIHADRAIGLVLTMDDPLAVEHSVHEVRELWPQLPIFARARDTEHAQRLKRLGATEVVQETVEASLQLAGRVLEHMQLPDETMLHVLDQQRAQEFVASQHDALDDILIFDKTDP